MGKKVLIGGSILTIGVIGVCSYLYRSVRKKMEENPDMKWREAVIECLPFSKKAKPADNKEPEMVDCEEVKQE